MVRRYFRQAFRSEPPSQAVQIIPDLRALLRACVAGTGVTVLPTYLCDSELKCGSLVQIHRPAQPVVNDLLLASNRVALQKARTLFVRDRILQVAALW
jgi:DNA-binding transcriptional LysR family regulator